MNSVVYITFYLISLHLRLSVNDIKFYVETGLVSDRYKGNDDQANYSLKAAINLHTWEHTYISVNSLFDEARI